MFNAPPLRFASAVTRPWEQWHFDLGPLFARSAKFASANTGHFADLPITAVKISLGIFTRKARDKDHFWRILGYIPAVSKHKSRGRRITIDI